MEIFFTSATEIAAGSAKIDVNHHETVFVMPFTDLAMAKKSSLLMSKRADASGLLVCVYDNLGEGFINIANQVFEKTSSTWFGYTAQDAFVGRNWLGFALEALNRQNAVLLGFNDGKWFGELAAFGLAQREWASKNYQGVLFSPEYAQHYADVELTILAQAIGRYAFSANSLMIEVDWEKDGKATNRKDKQTFQARLQQHFDGRDIPEQLLQKFA